MKRSILFSLLFSAAFPAFTLTPMPALAQVTTNDDALPTTTPTPNANSSKSDAPTPHRAEPRGHSAIPSTHSKPITQSARASTPTDLPPAPVSASQRVGLPPNVPATPPKPVIIKPPTVVVPTHPPVPPEEVKPDPDAQGKTEPRNNGLRVLFAPNSSLMNRAMIDAVKNMATKLAAQPQLRITLWSSASGSTEDLSTPRRIALARALAVRAILIREGVATTRIYPRATGLSPAGMNPPDRLDLIAEGSVPVSPSQAQFGTTSKTHSKKADPSKTTSSRTIIPRKNVP